MDPEVEKAMKALAALLSLVETTTTEVRAICNEVLTQTQDPDDLVLSRALLAIEDLASDLEIASIECRLTMTPVLRHDDTANVDPEDLVPVDYSPTLMTRTTTPTQIVKPLMWPNMFICTPYINRYFESVQEWDSRSHLFGSP